MVYGVYVTIVAVFTASNIIQVGRVVFANQASTAEPRAPKVGPACAASLAAEIRAIDTAQARALTEPSTDAAEARYRSERQSPTARAGQASTGNPTHTCASEPSGADALAALARLDRIAEAHAVRAAGELSTVRLAAQSFIRDEPR